MRPSLGPYKCVVRMSRRKPQEHEFVCDAVSLLPMAMTEYVHSWPHVGNIITSDIDHVSNKLTDRCRSSGE